LCIVPENETTACLVGRNRSRFPVFTKSKAMSKSKKSEGVNKKYLTSRIQSKKLML